MPAATLSITKNLIHKNNVSTCVQNISPMERVVLDTRFLYGYMKRSEIMEPELFFVLKGQGIIEKLM
jgi:hypothetical protein